MCKTLIQTLSQDARDLFSDEAHFYISRNVTKQNMYNCKSKNPKLVHERHLHGDKVTVWSAISSEFAPLGLISLRKKIKFLPSILGRM